MAPSISPKMAKRTATMRIQEAKLHATRSWPWVIVRIIQITMCAALLGLSLYLRFSWHHSSLARRNALPLPEESETPPWLHTESDDDSDSQDGDFNYHPKKGWGFSPYVTLDVFMADSLVSLASAFSTLLFYCCDKLSLEFVLVWDILLSLIWLVGAVIMGKLITNNSGWSSSHFIANLYKTSFFFAVLTCALFLVSSGLGLRLTLAIRRAAGSKYAPVPMTPPYMVSQTRGETGSTYTSPASGGVHDSPDNLASEHR